MTTLEATAGEASAPTAETRQGSGARQGAKQNIALSVCIPTYNRAPMLDMLLKSLARETAALDGLVEIIVSDNASTDNTAEVCAASGLGDRLRYFRHEVNLGAEVNYQFALSQACGSYSLYLADDDIVFWPAIIKALNALGENRNAVALYAPWFLVDLVDEKITGQFYHHPERRTFSHRDRLEHVRFILKHQVFSEIGIFKTSAFRNVRPLIDHTAFWAFTMPAELLNFGEVIYSEEPFYGSVTRHPAMAERVQAGHEEVMDAWDRYRGGVEHLVGLAGPLPEAERAELLDMVDGLVQARMIVALRLRLAHGRDAIQSYFLGSRLRGLGREADLPLPMEVLSLRAAIGFLDGRIASQVNGERIVLAGAFSAEEADWMSSFARIPVVLHEPGRQLAATDIALVSSADAPGVDAAELVGAGFVGTLPELMAKFP